MAAILQASAGYDNPQLMDWDDLRIIAAIRDSGTFAGAGIRLGMDETTISRRLARLQKTLGVTLFAATDGVRKPTAHCEAILDHVQEIARHVAEIGALGNAARGVAGRIRLATINSLAEEILAPKSAEFLLRNPGLTLQLHDIRTERQFCALGGRPGRPAAQAGEGQFHHYQARGCPPLSVRAAGTIDRRGTGHLRIPRRTRQHGGDGFSEGPGPQGAKPIHHRQSFA